MQIIQVITEIISKANPFYWIRKLYNESHDWEYTYKQLQSLDNIKKEFADTEQTAQVNIEIKRILNRRLGAEKINDYKEVYLIFAGCCLMLSGVILYCMYSFIHSVIDLLNLTGLEVAIVIIIMTIGLAFIISGMINFLTKVFLKTINHCVQFFQKNY